MKFRNVFSKTLKKITQFIKTQHNKDKKLDNTQQMELFKLTIRRTLRPYSELPLLDALMSPEPNTHTNDKPISTEKPSTTTTSTLTSMFTRKIQKTKTTEQEEVTRILNILEGYGQYDKQGHYRKGEFHYKTVDDLRTEIERHFILQENLQEFPGSHLGDAMAATLEAFYTHVIQPNELANASHAQKQLALKARIDAAINFYTATHKSARYRGYRALVNEEINTIALTETDNFVSAWLGEKNEHATAISQLKKKLPRTLKREITKEFIRYQAGQIPVGEFYDKLKINYTLEDYILYALNKHQSKNNAGDLESVKNILNTDHSDSEKIHEIRKLKNRELKKYCQLAIKMYQRDKRSYQKKQKTKLKRQKRRIDTKMRDSIKQTDHTIQRTFMTKQWWPTDNEENIIPKAKLKGVIIGIHGWRAHKEHYADLARQAQKKGYLFIAYDQRGWGETKERKKYGLMEDSLRLDFRKFVTQVEHEYPDIHLGIVGHSLGGAIPSLEMNFIETLSEERIKKDKKPISLRLIAPAFAGTLDVAKSSLNPKAREARPEKMKMTRNDPRFYKVFPNWDHYYVIKFLATATPLTNLMKKSRGAMIQQFSKKDRKTRIHIDGFQSDNAVAHSIFVDLQNKLDPEHDKTDKVTKNNITIQTKAGYGHDAHLERFCGPYNQEIIDDFDKDFEIEPLPQLEISGKGPQQTPRSQATSA